MLGSEHAGERASAALQAETFRKRHGLTWEEMIQGKTVYLGGAPPWQKPEPAPPPPPPVDPAHEAAQRQAAEDLAAAQAKWAREDAARKATWKAAQTSPEPEPDIPWTPPQYTPWTPPRPPRPLPFERIWRPKMEMAMSPRGLFFAIVGVWIISIAGVIAEKF
jgi:hypothetical protein